MSFETISLLLNWMEMGALLAILFRLSSTFNLIANTQRELRRAMYHLGERRGAELGTDNAFDRPGIASVSRSRLEQPLFFEINPHIRVAGARLPDIIGIPHHQKIKERGTSPIRRIVFREVPATTR